MRASGLLLATWLVAFGARAEDLAPRLHDMLWAGVEQSVAPETVAALGPEVVPALIALFADAEAPRPVRLRALSLLAQLDDVRAQRHFEALSRGELRGDALLQSALVTRRALEALSLRARPGLKAADLARLLAHSNEGVRHAAAELAAGSEGPDIEALVRARRDLEPSARVRALLEARLRGRSARRPALRLVRPESAQPPR